MTTEQATTRQPTFGTTRGQIIFRYNHKQLERENDFGEVETYWQCSYVLLPKKTDISSHRTMISGALNQEVNTYINSHYDQGTQSSFNGIYAKRDTPDTVKDDLDLVWAWIATVMGYYYQKKNDILTLEAFDEVTWDFSQFDSTKPDVTLAGIMAELAG